MASLPCQAPSRAPAPAAPVAVAVVSPLFCAPGLVQLTVQPQESSGYTVTNASGAVVLKARTKTLSFHNRLLLLDAAGHPILTLKEKKLTMHHRWEVFRGDSSNARDLLFYTKKKSDTEMDVFLAANTMHRICDFKMQVDYDGSKAYCALLYLGNTNAIIARMNRKHGFSTVLLEVFPHVDHVFVGALVMILNEIHKEDCSESIDFPSEDSPVENCPAEHHPVENYSAEHYPAEHYPVENCPAEHHPVENYSAELVPSEDSPVENCPAEHHPVENYSAEHYPAEHYPVENYSAEHYPAEHYPVENYSAENYAFDFFG
ncbi:protein LURP-one-related 10-like isoform X2 [Setaria italica]|uniref:protein LURP-one-related 10-like isoform X2 n=1 Tax=Setaria italica TaxID=4555 RepID=UPI0006464E36|nr:protein LURP-one-related 10-like isoform X2 [Setaria italica]